MFIPLNPVSEKKSCNNASEEKNFIKKQHLYTLVNLQFFHHHTPYYIVMLYLRFSLLLLFSVFCSLNSVFAQPTGLTLATFSTGYSRPVCIENCGDNRMFIVQQRGIIYITDMNGVKLTTPFLDITSLVNQSGNECGLLGLAFHPNYATNGYFYVNYTNGTDCNTSYVMRYTRSTGDPNIANPSSAFQIMTVSQPYSNHNGGNMEFGPDGYLYLGFGDGGSGGDPQGYAQNTMTRLGKMLRIDVDGGSPFVVPPTNPYVGVSGYLSEIWAIGLRNPWRFSFDPLNGSLWIGDVGQDGWEEIDYVSANSAGINYGWKCYEGNTVYSSGSCNINLTYTFPVLTYPSDNASGSGCSITGGFVYRGVQFGDMHGSYVFADYCSGKFWVANVDPPNVSPFSFTMVLDEANFQISTFGTDYLGELYVAALMSGTIYRVQSTNCAPLSKITTASPTETLCEGDNYLLEALTGQGFTYQWLLNGSDISGATNSSYLATETGVYTVRVIKNPSCFAVSNSVNLLFKEVPDPQISGESIVCNDGSTEYVYSVEDVPGFEYEWTITSGNGTIVAGQNTNSITVTWNNGEVGNISVEVINP